MFEVFESSGCNLDSWLDGSGIWTRYCEIFFLVVGCSGKQHKANMYLRYFFVENENHQTLLREAWL